MLDLKYKVLWLSIGYALVAYVFYSSLTPHPIVVDINYFDKYAHTLGYFVLMGWFMQLYHGMENQIILACAFISMGVGIEFIQGMTGYRFFDVYDMLANASGVILAVSLYKTFFPNVLFFFERKVLKV